MQVGYKSRLYNIWAIMKQRCNNPKASGFCYYGAKGISFSPNWEEFILFAEWALKSGYNENLSLDRIDGSKDYCPENCRWADTSTQAANKSKRNRTKNKLIGVHKLPNEKWRAVINWEKKQIHLGVFHSEEEASIKRDLYIIFNNLPHKLNF